MPVSLLKDFAVQRFMLRSKIHRATLTQTDLNYEGSITVDRDLLEAAEILPGEQVHVLNLNNGERLVTYTIEGPAGSGTMLLNGPAARLGVPGDLIIVISYGLATDEEAKSIRPKVVLVDENNRIVKIDE
jgi:aspartate 1-decarboxylase